MTKSLCASLRVLVLAACLGVAACGEATAPKPTATGSWTGSGSGFTITMVLNEQTGNILGTGQIHGSQSVALTISGQRVNNAVALTLSASGVQPTNFSGTLTGTASMTGRLNGSGFNNESVSFTKQP